MRWPEYLVSRIQDIVILSDRGVESFIIPWADIVDDGDELLKDIDQADTAVVNLQLPDQTVKHVRVINLPTYYHKEIRKIRASDLQSHISVKGLVRTTGDSSRPRVIERAFRCLRCGHLETFVKQPRFGLMEPPKGSHCGACKKSQGTTVFEEVPERSTYINSQKVVIQERPDELGAGEQPQSLIAYLEHDLAGTVVPGQQIILNGVLRAVNRNARDSKDKSTWSYYMDVNSVEKTEDDFLDMQLTDDEIEECVNLAKDEKLIERIRASIAPSIYGMERPKDMMGLQLFGGVDKLLPEGGRVRGNIHIFLVGDPGLGKSQLLKFQSKLAPRSIYASGQASTKAGLTASAIRGPDKESFELVAGPVVLADTGIVCIDEIDKMKSEDRSSIHEAMEQGTVSVAKGGITATLKARTSVLAAANPKDDRFNAMDKIFPQIDLPATLMSRFDVIYTITDMSTEEHDRKLAEHVGRTQSGVTYSNDAPPIAPAMLKRYVAYARRVCFPKITPEIVATATDYYVRTRSTLGPLAMDTRQLESVYRLSEANARMRLSDVVELEDVERATEIVSEYLRRVATDEDGHIDVTMIQTGHQMTQIKKQLRIYSMIQDAGELGIGFDALMETADAEGMSKEHVEHALKNLDAENQIFSPGYGLYRTVR